MTFCTKHRQCLPGWARSIVLGCCVHDHGTKYNLRVAVVMPDHVHLILTPLVDNARRTMISLSEIMKGIKSSSSHAINRQLNRSGAVWQEESFDRVLRLSETLDAKIAYILANPVRKGLANVPSEYPWLWQMAAKSASSEAEPRRNPDT